MPKTQDVLKTAVATTVQDAIMGNRFWKPLDNDGNIREISATRSSARETLVRVVPGVGGVRYFLVTVKEMM